MKVGEFASRTCASRLSKKAKFEAAFERARRDLRLLDAAPALPRRQRWGLRNGVRLTGPFSHSPDKTKRLKRKKPNRLRLRAIAPIEPASDQIPGLK